MIEYPNVLFLALNSNSHENPGYYKLVYRYINRDPASVEQGLVSLDTVEALEALGTKARNDVFVGSPMYYASLYLIGGLLFVVIVLLITLAICRRKTRMMNEVVIM